MTTVDPRIHDPRRQPRGATAKAVRADERLRAILFVSSLFLLSLLLLGAGRLIGP